MIISLCIPCMNRTYVLRETLPIIIRTANASPPVEIVVLNYDSKDDLEEYLGMVRRTVLLAEGNTLIIPKVNNQKYYNSARARNCCVKASSGEYIIQLSTEALPVVDYVGYIRNRLISESLVWMCEDSKTRDFHVYAGRFIVCRRKEFIDAGGYDERFRYYAPEDRDICMRLHRRGGKFAPYPLKMIDETFTPNKEKLRNLDVKPFTGKIWVKRQMSQAMHSIYKENNAKGVLVANEGKDWGKG